MFTNAQPLRVEVGRAWLWQDEVPDLDIGSTIEFDVRGDRDTGVYLDSRLIARGHAVVVGGKLGIEVSELVPGDAAEGKSH
jgi:flagellar motor switch/type III secretory pathway protein FliN